MNDYYNDFENDQVREYFETPDVPKEKLKKNKKDKDPFIGFTFQQLIVCVLALLAVLIFGGWDSDISRNVKSKYVDLFCQRTSIDEVMGAFSQNGGEIDVSSTDLATATDTNLLGNAVLVSTTPESTESTQNLQKVALIKTNTLTENVVNLIKIPLEGRVTSEFGYRIHPIYGEYLFHSGIDIGGDYGEDIVAALPGEVVEAQYSDSYGYYIKLKHSNGLETLYAHCDELYKKVGQKVDMGEVICSVGSTGVSTGPHLHFEVISFGNHVNPRWVLNI